MTRFLTIGLFAFAMSASAQTPWMRTVELRCAYHHASKDERGGPEHHILLFYENDSVVNVIIAEWEGVLEFDHSLSPVRLIEDFVEEFHCEPERFNINNGVAMFSFAGASMVWRDQYYDVARFEQNG